MSCYQYEDSNAERSKHTPHVLLYKKFYMKLFIYINIFSSFVCLCFCLELFQEVLRYPAIKFDKDTVDLWYRPNISREQGNYYLYFLISLFPGKLHGELFTMVNFSYYKNQTFWCRLNYKMLLCSGRTAMNRNSAGAFN